MLLSRPVLLFAGKGGVGKTTLATAAALRSADAGTRTLLVSTDPAHSTADLLGTPLGPTPTDLGDRLSAVELDPEAEAERYVAAVRDRVADLTPPGMRPEVDRQLAIARDTPGVAEAAVLERLAQLLDSVGRDRDRLIVDTAPFGHTLRLLAMPETMRTWLEAVTGRRRALGALERAWRAVRGRAPDTDRLLAALEGRQESFARLRAALANPDRSMIVLVAIPERLSVLETARSAETLREAGMSPAALVINRVMPEDARGEWAEARRAQEAEHVDALRSAFRELPAIIVPQLSHDVRDRDAARYIGARLEALA